MRHHHLSALVWVSLAVGLSTNAARAADPLIAGCQSEVGDTAICECTSDRLREFLGKKNFSRYQAFFTIYAERHAEQEARSGETLTAWNGAMGNYAKTSGEDLFNVMGWVQDYQYAHRYALKACGATLPDSDLDQSLLFYGESR